jgi:hypothetical protein
MKTKIVGLFVCMLLITTILPITALAGDEENPEITDVAGDARSYLDIKKAWFYEDPSTPEMLYTTIEITNPRVIPFKQHLVVSWQMNGEHYASMLGIGYSLTQWLAYVSIIGRGALGDPKPVVSFIEGSFDTTTGTVTCIIPKSTIGNPQPGDVLTNTQSQCFERFGFWGRLGFTNIFRYAFFEYVGKNQLEDTAPDFALGYGLDYIIQY